MGISSIGRSVSNVVSTVAKAATSSVSTAAKTGQTQSADSFDGGDAPTQAEVDAKYNSMSPEDRNALYKRLKDNDSSLTPLESKVAMKTAIRKGIMNAFQQMAEEQADQIEKVLNKMNHG